MHCQQSPKRLASCREEEEGTEPSSVSHSELVVGDLEFATQPSDSHFYTAAHKRYLHCSPELELCAAPHMLISLDYNLKLPSEPSVQQEDVEGDLGGGLTTALLDDLAAHLLPISMEDDSSHISPEEGTYRKERRLVDSWKAPDWNVYA